MPQFDVGRGKQISRFDIRRRRSLLDSTILQSRLMEGGICLQESRLHIPRYFQIYCAICRRFSFFYSSRASIAVNHTQYLWLHPSPIARVMRHMSLNQSLCLKPSRNDRFILEEMVAEGTAGLDTYTLPDHHIIHHVCRKQHPAPSQNKNIMPAHCQGRALSHARWRTAKFFAEQCKIHEHSMAIHFSAP